MSEPRSQHSKSATEWPNGVPKISDAQRRRNLESPAALRDLISTIWLYIGRFEETQLTTEQKELLADVVENDEPQRNYEYEYERWWRE
jgi:hypothetical protein